MALTPIRFQTYEDLQKFIAKLTEAQLVHYKNNALYGDLDELAKHLIVATNGETYFLNDVLTCDEYELQTNELTFVARTLKKHRTKLSEHLSMQTIRNEFDAATPRLLHNRPLAEALLGLNQNPECSLNMKDVFCDKTKRNTVFPVLTEIETTLDLVEVIKEVFCDDNIPFETVPSSVYVKMIEQYHLNLPLLDLMKLNHQQLLSVLQRLLKTCKAEDTAKLQANFREANLRLKKDIELAGSTLLAAMTDLEKYRVKIANNHAPIAQNIPALQELHMDYKNSKKQIGVLEEKLAYHRDRRTTFALCTSLTSFTVVGGGLFSILFYLEVDSIVKTREALHNWRKRCESLSVSPLTFIETQLVSLDRQFVARHAEAIHSLATLVDNAMPRRSSLQQHALIQSVPPAEKEEVESMTLGVKPS